MRLEARFSRRPGILAAAALGLLWGCSGLQNPSQLPFVPTQPWVDSVSQEISTRMEQRLKHRFGRIPQVLLIDPTSREGVLDSFPMAVRKDTVVRRLWWSIGLYRTEEAELIQAGRLRQIATRALYVPRSHRVLLVPTSDPDQLEQSMAHEMVHAMQRELIPLERRLRSIRDEDEMVGFLGALEGQAEFLAPVLLPYDSRRNDCGLPASPLWLLAQAIHNQPQFRAMPPALTLPSYAPYVFGWKLACHTVARYGLDGADTLLYRSPAGSWQLWNPESYLANERPFDWDTSWADFGLPRNWKPVGQTRIGEIRLAALLLEWDREQAMRILEDREALGWKGDRLWVARHSDGTFGNIWALRFADGEAARIFARAWWSVQSIRLSTPLPSPRWNRSGLEATGIDSLSRVHGFSQAGEELFLVQGFAPGQTLRILQQLSKRRSR